MSIKLVVDFDGTLIDDSQRHWSVFKAVSRIEIKKEQYWKYRRSGVSNRELYKQLVGKDNFNLEGFRNLIEEQEYLNLDIMIASQRKLEHLSSAFEMILCSVRSQRENCEWQLEKLDMHRFFSAMVIISHNQLMEYGKGYKAPALLDRFSFNQNDSIIGDTEIDICSGKNLGIRSIAVLSGIRNKEFLKTFEPNTILDDINSFD